MTAIAKSIFILNCSGRDAACPGIPLRLLVAVQNATASHFVEAAEQLHLGELFRWETNLAEVIGLYAAADAYVSPTREDAFALPREAMASGLPVVTSSQNGDSQIINDGVDGFVLKDPRDAGRFKEK